VFVWKGMERGRIYLWDVERIVALLGSYRITYISETITGCNFLNLNNNV